MTAYIVPVILLFILTFAYFHKKLIFASFIRGAREGAITTFNIFPSLLGLLIAVYMLRASGAIELVSLLLAPILRPLGIDARLLPLMLLKPFTGSGSLALGAAIIEEAGVNSFVGRVAAVMLGSCETTFYTIAIYFGAVGVVKTRYVIPAALCADLTAFLISVIVVRLLM